jgi:hypothetical protein
VHIRLHSQAVGIGAGVCQRAAVVVGVMLVEMGDDDGFGDSMTIHLVQQTLQPASQHIGRQRRPGLVPDVAMGIDDHASPPAISSPV